MKIKDTKIKSDIVKFLKSGNPILSKLKKIPQNDSLVRLGYLDSFGLIELIDFIEKNFKVEIKDEEITPEIFGSINKMSLLIIKKLNKKKKL